MVFRISEFSDYSDYSEYSDYSDFPVLAQKEAFGFDGCLAA